MSEGAYLFLVCQTAGKSAGSVGQAQVVVTEDVGVVGVHVFLRERGRRFLVFRGAARRVWST